MKNLKDIDEFEFIENIKKWINSKELKSDGIIGIGDDAAIVKNFHSNLVTSIDTLVEGTHFTREITSFFDLGWKSLAVNISDIAAMGASPKYAMISVACPTDLLVSDLKKFYFGFKKLADLANVKLIGGDTVRSDSKIVVSVVIFGETLKGNFALRGGAKPGELVCATGSFGNAAFGLDQLLANKNVRNFFTKSFNAPMPRFQEGKFLGKNGFATAMLDVSDGLVFSLYEISDKSEVGILLFEEKICVKKELKKQKNYLDYVLYGGEDYELLFCVKAKNFTKILEQFPSVYILGETTDKFKGVKIKTRDNKIKSLKKKGYSAF